MISEGLKLESINFFVGIYCTSLMWFTQTVSVFFLYHPNDIIIKSIELIIFLLIQTALDLIISHVLWPPSQDCVDYLFLGMATNNQLPVFWTSWLQFPVQYDFSVSFSVPSLTSFSILHTFCFTREALRGFRDGMMNLYTKMVPIHTSRDAKSFKALS